MGTKSNLEVIRSSDTHQGECQQAKKFSFPIFFVFQQVRCITAARAVRSARPFDPVVSSFNSVKGSVPHNHIFWFSFAVTPLVGQRPDQMMFAFCR